MARTLTVLSNIAVTVDAATEIDSDIFQIGPAGTDMVAEVTERPLRLVCVVGTDQDGTLTVWEAAQRADLPLPGAAAVPLSLRETIFPYLASPSAQVFVVENLALPFIRIRYVNGGNDTGEFRLYCAAHFD